MAIEDLLPLIKKRDRLVQVANAETADNMRTVMDIVVNQSCAYVSILNTCKMHLATVISMTYHFIQQINQQVNQTIDCRNSTQLELLHKRMTFAEAAIKLATTMRRNFSRMRGKAYERYGYWKENVLDTCTTACNEVQDITNKIIISNLFYPGLGNCTCPN